MLAPWILTFFPPHETYVEPFGGAASLLMRKERAKAEIYNDLNAEVVNFFRVLRDPVRAAEFRRQLELTPYARDEYDAAFGKGKRGSVERARRLIARSIMGHGCDSICAKSGFRSKGLDRSRYVAGDWANYPRQISAFCERLRGVTIERRDAFVLMKDFDTPATLFYVDPPYLQATRGRRRRNYTHELTDGCHERLIDELSTLRGMVILSGYPHASYERLGWRRHETEALADGARPRTECLWLNPAAEREQSQGELAL